MSFKRFVSKSAENSRAGFTSPQLKLPGNMERLSLFSGLTARGTRQIDVFKFGRVASNKQY